MTRLLTLKFKRLFSKINPSILLRARKEVFVLLLVFSLLTYLFLKIAPQPALASTLFNITHDANNLNEYNITVTDGGDLSTGTPGLASTTAKMEAVIDDTTAIYGRKNQAAPASNQIRFRLYMDPNSYTPNNNEVVYTLITQPYSNGRLIHVNLRNPADGYKIRVFGHDDGGTEKGDTHYDITDDAHYVEVYIVRASSNVASDGTMTMWIDGVQKYALSGIDNYDRFAALTSFDVGMLGCSAGVSGTIYVDEFVVNDDGEEIGEVVSFDNGWSHRFKYTIDNSNVGETLTEFPLHIDLTNDAPAHFWSNVDSNGADIRIVDEDGTTNLSGQAHLEGWDYNNSQGHIWVKRTIAASGNSEFVYVYYDNSNVTTAFDDTSKQATYNSNYVGVWHLNETTTGNTDFKDATSNNNDSTSVTIDGEGSNPDAIGKANGAVQFDGSNDHISMADNSSLDPPNDMTIEAWVKYDQLSSVKGEAQYFVNKQDDNDPWASYNFTLYQGDDTPAFRWVNGDRTEYFAGKASVATINTWYYYAGVHDGSTLRFYLDGSSSGTYTGSPTGTILDSDAGLHIGSFWTGGGYTDTHIDEIRISNTTRSAEWIEFAYLSDKGDAGTADSVPSTPTIDNFNDGSWTTDSTPTFQFDLSDPNSGDIVKYQIQIDDNSDFSSAVVDYTETSGSAEPRSNVTYTPSALDNGSYYWRVRAIDDDNKEGSWSTANSGSIAFKVDTTAPSSGSISIDSGATYAISTSVTLTISSSDGGSGLYQMMISENSGFTGVSWESYSTSKSFTLSSGDGSKTVYIKFKDTAGNESSSYSNSITLDTAGPSNGSISINSGATYTTNRSVTLTISASDATYMMISENSDFSSASWEDYSTSKSLTLSTGDRAKTVYIKFKDDAGNETSSVSDSITSDATAPASFDLDSPGDNSYTNSERPTFKWKATTDATAGLSKYVLEIDNPSVGSGQPSGDFTIDDIPTSRTTDYETNKYFIHYENFSDSDSTNNYISVYTKSHSDWGTSENDGKLREGRVSWKVKAVDSAGNETSSSRTLFVDKTNPSVAFTQINSSIYSGNDFSTTDKTPTIFGKITDSLSGGDSSQTQDENGPRIASGPKQVEIKVEKKEGLTYKLHTLYTINIDKPRWSCDGSPRFAGEAGKEVTDNSKQKCDKYLPFEYTSKENLDLGIYKITLTGKDKVDNTGNTTSFSLTITTLEQITTPEEKEIIEEEILRQAQDKQLTPEEKEKVEEELEITKPTEPQKRGVVENVTSKVAKAIANVYWKIVDNVKIIASAGVRLGKQIAESWNNFQKFAKETNQKSLAFFRQAYNSLAQNVPGVIGTGLKTIGNVSAIVGDGINNSGKLVTQAIASVIGKVISPSVQKVTTFLAITAEYWLDKEPTKISNVKVEKLTVSLVVISWETNHLATSKVNYGETLDYGNDVQSSRKVHEHKLEVTGLKPETKYYYEVMSQNKNYVYDAHHEFLTPRE